MWSRVLRALDRGVTAKCTSKLQGPSSRQRGSPTAWRPQMSDSNKDLFAGPTPRWTDLITNTRLPEHNFKEKEKKNMSRVPDGGLTPEHTGRLTVGGKIILTLLAENTIEHSFALQYRLLHHVSEWVWHSAAETSDSSICSKVTSSEVLEATLLPNGCLAFRAPTNSDLYLKLKSSMMSASFQAWPGDLQTITSSTSQLPSVRPARRDLQTPTVKEEIHRYSSQYSARLSAHPYYLIVNLMELPDNRRLRRHLPNDLPSVTVVFVILVFKV
jgi:hypothetical protein